MNLEVLVTTMNQHDISKFHSMNIQTDAVIANQSDYNGYEESVLNGKIVKMISTKFRGVSRNRNTAIEFSTGDYIMFADDDMVFIDGYENIVLEEFEKHHEADAIKFYVDDSSSEDKISWGRPEKFKKATRRNIGSAGVVALVIRKEVLVRNNLYFHEYFGPGTDYYCGEDTIFLQKLINKKIKLYITPTKVSDIIQQKSTWFENYDEKYFRIIGNVLANIYPKLVYIIILRSAFRAARRKNCNLSFFKILRCYYEGTKIK